MSITRTLCSIALLVSLLPATLSAAGGPEDAANIDVTLIVDGKKAGETWITTSAGGTLIEIPAAPVLSALASMLDDVSLRRLELEISPLGTFTNKILSRFGVSLTIDSQAQVVMLGLLKTAHKIPAPIPGPKGTGAGTPSDKLAAAQPKKKTDTSGPWTSPPLQGLSDTAVKAVEAKSGNPGMPGPGTGGIPKSGPASDQNWEPNAADTNAAKPSATTAAKTPQIQFQTYQVDKTRDELFEEVFKRKPPPLPSSVEVTLLVDGKSYGTLWLLYNKEKECYTFPVDPVLNALQGLVRADLYDKLTQRATTRSRFTVNDLIESGFPTVLNTSVFELSTGVPAQLLGSKTHSLMGRNPDPNSVTVTEPKAFSAFANARVKDQLSYFQYNPGPFDSNGYGYRSVQARNERLRQPLIGNFDGAVNALNWVVEGKWNVWEKPEMNAFEASRQDFRMVHDWPRQALRLTAGDLIFPTSGFQSFLQMGGIGLSRDFSLQPHLVAYPVKEFEFFLPNPSEVKIYINGILKGSFQLEQGTHDLQGFEFARGESDVEIQITDNSGQKQTLNFNFIHEPTLLAKGLSAFSFNVGVSSRNTYNLSGIQAEPGGYEVLNYEYDSEHPVMFLDYKRGISNTLTLEGYSQALDTAGILGINALQALKIGKVSTDIAGSYLNGKGFDWAGNLEYAYIPKATTKTSPLSWRMRAEYLGPEFFRPNQSTSLLGSLTYGGSVQKNGGLANLTLGLSYSLRFDSTDFYSGYIGVSKNWKTGWSGDISLKNTFDQQRHTNTTIAMNINYYFSTIQQSVRASQRVENHRPDGTETGRPPDWDYTTDLNWDYNVSSPFPNNPALSMTTSFGPFSNDYNASAEWKGNQGVAQLLARRIEPKNFSIINNYADLTLQTSLVYVDGNFAFSRPITNSFLMVKGIENEKACDILVNDNELGYDAKASSWLPGVVPNLTSYYLKKIHLNVIDPPFGSGEERSDFTIYPGYKNGYAFYMGTKASVIAFGTLLTAPETPVVYQTFTATALNGKHEDPVMGFTNGSGKFQLTRLQPGKYLIEVDIDGKPYTSVITLPKNSEGLKYIGSVQLSPK